MPTYSLRPQNVSPALMWFVAATIGLTPSLLLGGQFFRSSAVGGISIDAEGVLEMAETARLEAIRTEILQGLDQLPDKAREGVPIRKVSLRQLEDAVAAALANRPGDLPDSVKYLAGLQRVEYVLVYPEQNDIVLAGPGEGWTVNDKGIVVGETTRRPVLLLDDLLVALRSVHAARLGGITCSIDPRPEGVKAMQQVMARQRQYHPAVLDAVREAVGPQRITVEGVPHDSHLARVLVAADYQMKRISMELEPSTVIPSYLDLLKANRRAPAGGAIPRWWLECNYDALERGENGLSWRIKGQGVKAMTEDSVYDAAGVPQQLGKSSPVAQKWADMMTDQYAALAEHDAIFGQLRNVMDLCVVAALLEKEDLFTKAECPLAVLRDSESGAQHESWFPARTVSTQCSVVKRGRNFIITASGGVQIGSWQVLDQVEDRPGLERIREASQGEGTAWWWN